MRTFFRNYLQNHDMNKSNLLNAGCGHGSLDGYVFTNSIDEINIEKKDTIIISASPIPGNETLVSKTIDNLFKLGAEVFHSKTSFVHVHGHASQEELKLMLNLLK